MTDLLEEGDLGEEEHASSDAGGWSTPGGC